MTAAIKAYVELSKVIYNVASKQSLKKPKLYHQALQSQMEKILRELGLPADEPFLPGPDSMDSQSRSTALVIARTFVVASESGSTNVSLLRNYRCPSNDPGLHMTVPQAANATMAHPGFWPPITVNGIEYDGACVPPNPSEEAIIEALQIWPDRPICLVSLGTGLSYKILPSFRLQPEPALRAPLVFQMRHFASLSNRRLGEQCVRFLAHCEEIHWRVNSRKEVEEGSYFRLNVPLRMSERDFQEWTQLNRLEALTEEYLNNNDEVRDLVRILVGTVGSSQSTSTTVAETEDDGSLMTEVWEERDQLSARENHREEEIRSSLKCGLSDYPTEQSKRESALRRLAETVCSGPIHPD